MQPSATSPTVPSPSMVVTLPSLSTSYMVPSASAQSTGSASGSSEGKLYTRIPSSSSNEIVMGSSDVSDSASSASVAESWAAAGAATASKTAVANAMVFSVESNVRHIPSCGWRSVPPNRSPLRSCHGSKRRALSSGYASYYLLRIEHTFDRLAGPFVTRREQRSNCVGQSWGNE